MFDSIHIVPKLNAEKDPAIVRVVREIESIAFKIRLPVVARMTVGINTLVIAVGGDGTMLEAMRVAAMYGATALGVNMGHLGFLTDVSLVDRSRDGQSFGRLIEQVLCGAIETYVDERVVLSTSLVSDKLACNEISVSQKYSDSMISYHLRVGRVSAGIHKANSIMISTATGSTAYSLSAGGALMMPHVDALQIVPVAPITMTSRPIIVGTYSRITLDVWGLGIAVRSDGQTIYTSDQEYTKDAPFVLDVCSYENKAKMLHLAEWNFFTVLTEKLGWISC